MAAFSRLWVLLVPVLLLIGAIEASVLPRFGSADPATLFGRQQNLQSPLCAPTCDLHTCGSGGSCLLGGIKKREWLDGLSFSNHNYSDYHGDVSALGKRLFTFVAGSTNAADASGRRQPKRKEVDAYLPAVFDGAEPYYGNPLPTVAVGAGNVVTDERAVSQQVQFGNVPFSIISSRMHGCTTIVVASTRAVWMTHLWESYSNGKDADGNNLVAAGDPAFNQRVLMFLQGQAVANPVPNGYTAYIAPTGPGINANLFNIKATDQTTVFIFTPVKAGTAKADMNNANSLKYKDRYGADGEVRNTIGAIFGDSRPRVTIVPYMPLNTNDPAQAAQFGTDARGNVLFQYDPNSDGNGQKAWRLFMEDRVFYKNI